MATEKILNTRIGLKIDTLENWNKSSLVLKKGEVAFATVAATEGSGLTEPVIMAKIGDGSKTFAQLTWDFYAKASDVHSWAKQDQTAFETYLRTFISDTIEDTDLDTRYSFELPAEGDNEGKLIVKSTLYTKGVAGTETQVAALDFIAPDELTTILDNYYTKQEIDDKFDALDSNFTIGAAIGNGLTLTVEQTDGKITKVEGTIDPNYFETKTDATTKFNEAKSYTDTQINSVTALIGTSYETKSDATSKLTEAKNYTDTEIAELKEYVDDNDDNTEYHIEYDSNGKKIKLVAGADASQMEIPTDDFIKDGMIQSVEVKDNNLVITWNTDADKGENSITSIPLTELVDVMTGVDGTTIKVDVSADDKISAEVKTGSLKDGHIAADAAIAKSKLHSSVQASLDKADNSASTTDLAEQIEATQQYASGLVTELVNSGQVKNNTEAIAAINDATTGIKATLIGTDNDATTADTINGAKNYAKEEATGALNGAYAYADDRISEIEAGTRTAGNAAKLNGQEATYYATAQQVTDLANGQVNTNKEAIADINEELDTYGDIVTHNVNEFATAAQGTKADSAIQSVTSVAGNGIKATTSNTAVTIDWDPEVTLVFDCGGSGVTA